MPDADFIAFKFDVESTHHVLSHPLIQPQERPHVVAEINVRSVILAEELFECRAGEDGVERRRMREEPV